jgi:hypothetical protein
MQALIQELRTLFEAAERLIGFPDQELSAIWWRLYSTGKWKTTKYLLVLS